MSLMTGNGSASSNSTNAVRSSTSNRTRNQEATIYIGNLDEKVTEALLYELMVQAGPIVNVNIPKDRITASHQGFGFVEFHSEEDAEYAVKVMNLIRLFGRPLKVNKTSANKKTYDIGATLFVGNLSPEVDEKVLYDTFSSFGNFLSAPRIQRDGITGTSKGFGFVSYDNFESADLAIESINGQYLAGRSVKVTYAVKREGHSEKHGTAAERLLAAEAKRHNMLPSQQQQQPIDFNSQQQQTTLSSISVPSGMYILPQ